MLKIIINSNTHDVTTAATAAGSLDHECHVVELSIQLHLLVA